MTGAEPRTLDVRGLHCRFGDRVAVDDIDLTLTGGEIVGLVGRNGAGKTTTMRSIMGVVVPEAGTVSWGGHHVDARDRRTFGYMPEERADPHARAHCGGDARLVGDPGASRWAGTRLSGG